MYHAVGDSITDWAIEQARKGCIAKGGDFNAEALTCICPWGAAPDGRCLTVGEWAMAPEAQKKAQCEAGGGSYFDGNCSGATGGGGAGGGGGSGGGTSSGGSGETTTTLVGGRVIQQQASEIKPIMIIGGLAVAGLVLYAMLG